ncbi:sugar transferase [Paraburkholderia sp. 1N]|uniref:Sugar transferase n=1 Tax=Paraburkholderia solitsugae TaxID=2675748 RepID=A0ABX2BKL7_9BURK|nr:sugar transferase [Paraburkholderia solitsugae]NPT40343.1 sugar transferase [Paraburkholderia solitsugae]
MHAPIALFVFNRLDHADQTVTALAANDLASESDLFIFSDGPRTSSEAQKVAEVRAHARDITGFRSVTVYEQQSNIGLAASIIRGVTELCDRFGKVIVVEDDIVTSPHFLKFMNDALNIYENDPKVMHVSGCTYPVDPEALGSDDTFFLRVPLCWGWATWKGAWKEYARDFSLADQFTRSMRRSFDFDGTHPYWSQMTLNRRGRLTTWFVFWYATLYVQGGLALFPRTSLANNIGHDGSGSNCEESGQFATRLAEAPIVIHRLATTESPHAYTAHKKYFRKINGSLSRRVARKGIRRAMAIVSASTIVFRMVKI